MSAPTLETVTPAAAAATQAPLVIAANGRAVQLAIRAQLLIAVSKLWPALDPKRLDQTWPGWLQAMTLLTKTYHAQSSVAAAAFYRAAREHATQSPAPQSLIKLAPEPDAGLLARAYGYAGPGMLNRDIARPRTALTTTLGTAARLVADGGRATIIDTAQADPVAIGWYRLTDGQPCAFCAMLASRRIAYKSEKTADFQAHNDCGCTAAPAFSRDQALPAINHEALAVYRDSTRGVKSGGQLAAFRKAWDARSQAAS